MEDFVAAVGLVFVIEGIAFAAFPGLAKRAMAQFMETPEARLRTVGVVSAVLGVAVVWAVRA